MMTTFSTSKNKLVDEQKETIAFNAQYFQGALITESQAGGSLQDDYT